MYCKIKQKTQKNVGAQLTKPCFIYMYFRLKYDLALD